MKRGALGFRQEHWWLHDLMSDPSEGGWFFPWEEGRALELGLGFSKVV